MSENKLQKAITGCLIGTAIGDAMGLPVEVMSKKRQRKLFPNIDKHNFLFGKGMFSDDTEHTYMLVQALIMSAGNDKIFLQQFAKRLKLWLLLLPAGIGFATLRSIIKLWLGFSGNKSGVFSAGNGPAMRSAMIGVCYGDNIEKLKQLAKIATRITHTDPKAEYGALAIAYTAYLSSVYKESLSLESYFEQLSLLYDENALEFLTLLKEVIESVKKGESAEVYLDSIGLTKGVTGYMYHTVPIVLHCWLRNQKNYRDAINEVIQCGGDTDTTAAILGAIIGAGVYEEGIPEEWRKGLFEWPCNINWFKKLSEQLSRVIKTKIPEKPINASVIFIFVRNVFFLLVVLGHIIRRLLPPY